MGHYAYKAYGKQGMCKGKISAASRAEAAECLRRQGFLPVHIGVFACTYRGGKEGTEEKREAAGTDTAFSGVVGPVVGGSSYG